MVANTIQYNTIQQGLTPRFHVIFLFIYRYLSRPCFIEQWSRVATATGNLYNTFTLVCIFLPFGTIDINHKCLLKGLSCKDNQLIDWRSGFSHTWQTADYTRRLTILSCDISIPCSVHYRGNVVLFVAIQINGVHVMHDFSLPSICRVTSEEPTSMTSICQNIAYGQIDSERQPI